MKIRIKFSKQGAMKFIGHLDTLRYFQKAMRRADVDIRYSEGFSPHQIMSFAAPLGVGLTSSGEYVDIEVLSTGPSKEMVDRLNQVMVEDMEILSYRLLPDTAVNAMSLVAACDYTIRFRDGYESRMDISNLEFFQEFDRFLAEGNLEVIKKTKKGEKQIDLRPCIFEHSVPEQDNAIFLKLASGSATNIKPELVLEAFYKEKGVDYPPFSFQVNREDVYADISPEPADGRHLFKSLEAFGEDIE